MWLFCFLCKCVCSFMCVCTLGGTLVATSSISGRLSSFPKPSSARWTVRLSFKSSRPSGRSTQHVAPTQTGQCRTNPMCVERGVNSRKKSKNVSSQEKNVIKMSLQKKGLLYSESTQCEPKEPPEHKRRAVLASVSEVAEDDVAFDHKKPLAPWDALHTEENWEHWFHCRGAMSVCVCVRSAENIKLWRPIQPFLSLFFHQEIAETLNCGNKSRFPSEFLRARGIVLKRA